MALLIKIALLISLVKTQPCKLNHNIVNTLEIFQEEGIVEGNEIFCLCVSLWDLQKKTGKMGRKVAPEVRSCLHCSDGYPPPQS